MNVLHHVRRRALNARLKAAAWRFRRSVPEHVWSEHAAWLATCRSLARFPLPEEAAGDAVFVRSQTLRREALSHFRGRYEGRGGLRVLLHVPPARESMGGFSLFSNWLEGLSHLGIEAEAAPTGVPVMEEIERFRPTVFLTSDYESYLRWIDWGKLRKYRERHPFALVLVASAEHDGNTPEGPRLKAARERNVSFYVSFREPEYIEEHLRPWTAAGYDVLSVPFSANPIRQYHVPVAEPPLDYVFLASINPVKAPRYLEYLTPVIQGRRGVINGPGWGHDERVLGREYHPHIYGLGAIGLNVHIPISLNMMSEVNERTFILAVCGIFQLCDAPRALRRFFPEAAVPSASSASEYAEQFAFYLGDAKARERARLASLEAVYVGHTIFHRMVLFVERAARFVQDK